MSQVCLCGGCQVRIVSPLESAECCEDDVAESPIWTHMGSETQDSISGIVNNLLINKLRCSRCDNSLGLICLEYLFYDKIINFR